jgi:hypothetical protein
MTLVHATVLARDERAREHAKAMGWNPACPGTITATSSGTVKFGPQTWTIWRCGGCGFEAASPGPDHPFYGDDRRGDARPSGARL